jgi:hypothetical protein
MNQEIFRILFSLCRKQPWLEDKAEELENLLYSECRDDNEKNLVLELLERFIHISSEKYNDLIHELVENIATDPDLESNTTQIVAMTGDYSSDSAQFVLYGMKQPLQKVGWQEHLSVTQFQRSFREYNKKGKQHKNIVLIDEFVGSGKTVVGRVNTLKNLFTNETDITFKVRVLVASKVGIAHIQEQNIDIESIIYLDKGISDYYPVDTLQQKLSTMNNLETLLSPAYKDRLLPSFGYGQTECLYTRDNGNTPNSVFPLFWWPYLQTNGERRPLLIRAMGDA